MSSVETQIVCAESQALLTTLDDEVFPAIVCDPPYGIRWMNQKWDYDVPSVAHWKEVLRVAMPGAWLVSFGGSKTSHRVAVNIEDRAMGMNAGWAFYGAAGECAVFIDRGVSRGMNAGVGNAFAWQVPVKYYRLSEEGQLLDALPEITSKTIDGLLTRP